MSKEIHLKVITQEGVAVEEDAVSVRAPGELGSFGVLYNHAPLVSTLQPGKLIWRKASGESKTLVVGSGVVEVAKNNITLLTQSVKEPAASEERSF